ncbi:DUF6171 family protein [Paenibacillus physcomitrellae]|uniref:Uncharacterized protein n=1 Tax=Paenibacillus physcomitrellae TaxID=1619311 RepID=A0ABQ1GBZ8_9BACL|nr:DUF6171 family protein [Paenibacillus physcomitrellae]GGA40783.1 hypothetical protein GCM10010917_27540 [Paenibacillus physcomitrellae]
MAVNQTCKGCSADVWVTEAQIQKLLAGMEGKGFSFVSETVYQTRLAVCRTCPSLVYGTTCSHCGCLVEVSGKLAGKKCPHPAGSKWEKAEQASASAKS